MKVRPICKDAAIREADEVSAIGVMTSGNRDRDHDVVEPDGIDFSEWEAAGAPVLFAHDNGRPPIGSCLDPATKKLAVWKEGDEWVCKVFFDMGDPFAAMIAKKVKAGILRGLSVSFLPKDAEPLRDTGHHFRQVTLTELSVVSVPANERALFRSLLEGTSGEVRKELLHYCSNCNLDLPETVTEKLDTLDKMLDAVPLKKKKKAPLPQRQLSYEQHAARYRATEKYIRQESGKWNVYSRGGKLLGRHDSREDAERQLEAIEANKGETLMDVSGEEGRIDYGLGTAAKDPPLDESKSPIHSSPYKLRAGSKESQSILRSILAAARKDVDGGGMQAVADAEVRNTPGEIDRTKAGRWFIVDESGQDVDGPYTSRGQAEASRTFYVSGPLRRHNLRVVERGLSGGTTVGCTCEDKSNCQCGGTMKRKAEEYREQPGGDDNMGEEVPDTMEGSEALAKLYSHLGEVGEWLDDECDHPEVQAALRDIHKRHILPAIDKIKAAYARHYKDMGIPLDELAKGLESNSGPDGGYLIQPGEAGRVGAGEIPDDDEDEDDEAKGGPEDEIIDRYRDRPPLEAKRSRGKSLRGTGPGGTIHPAVLAKFRKLCETARQFGVIK